MRRERGMGGREMRRERGRRRQTDEKGKRQGRQRDEQGKRRRRCENSTYGSGFSASPSIAHLHPSPSCWAMPWVVLVVRLLYFSLLISTYVVEVLITAVWLICFLLEWSLKIGWTYLEI